MVSRNVPGSSTRPFLEQLENAHRELIGAMENLGRLTRDDEPDIEQLSEARWKISSASLARRMLWGRILSWLLPRVQPEQSAQLQRLQHADGELLSASTKHVARWTSPTILADWPGYRSASRDMRWKMIAAIEMEKKILRPMLMTLEAGHGDPSRIPDQAVNGQRH